MDYLKWSWYALWINQLIKWLIMCILSNQFIQLINSFAHSFCRYLLSIFFKCWELRYTDTSSESKNYFTFINVFIALLSNNLSSPTWWRMRTFLDLSINDGESDEAWPGMAWRWRTQEHVQCCRDESVGPEWGNQVQICRVLTVELWGMWWFWHLAKRKETSMEKSMETGKQSLDKGNSKLFLF